LGQLGRADEAQPLIAELQALNLPDVEVQLRLTAPYADPVHRAQLVEGLAKTGYQLG
jgi:hypothetical protein